MFAKATTTSSASVRMMDDRHVSALIGVNERTPAQWRYLGKFKNELPHFKIGRSVRYRESDVLAFIGNCQVGGKNIEVASK